MIAPVLILLAGCDKDDDGFGPMRWTQGGFLISATAFGVEAVEIDAATEEQFEILIAKNPSLDRQAARSRLARIPIVIHDGYRFSLGGVWVTGVYWPIRKNEKIEVALESYNGGAGGPPYLPALNHEWGHVFYGGSYEHQKGMAFGCYYCIKFRDSQ